MTSLPPNSSEALSYKRQTHAQAPGSCTLLSRKLPPMLRSSTEPLLHFNRKWLPSAASSLTQKACSRLRSKQLPKHERKLRSCA